MVNSKTRFISSLLSPTDNPPIEYPGKSRLTSYHNLYFLLSLMKQVREAIMNDNLLEFREYFFEEYGFNKANAKNF